MAKKGKVRAGVILDSKTRQSNLGGQKILWHDVRQNIRYIIGERERANLVVQLARFYFPIWHAVTVNRSNFTYTVSRACANISLLLQLAGLRVVGSRLALRRLYIQLFSALRVVALHITCTANCNHQVLAQLLHLFLPYISWIAPARQQC